MSCGACDCDDCQEGRQHDKAMNRSNDMDDVATDEDLDDGWATPIQRSAAQKAEPSPEAIKTWTAYAHRAFEHYKVKSIPLPTLASIICQECNVRPENYSHVSVMVADVIKACPDFEIRKGKNGGVFRKEVYAESTPKGWAAAAKVEAQYIEMKTMAGVPDLITGKLEDNYTCKGCGNTKLNSTEKSCWSCGRQVGT